MTQDDTTTLIADDQVSHIEDVLAAAPIEPGKLGHHTVLSVGGARVIVLAFDQGQHMKEHRSHHPLLLQALDGQVRVTAAGQTYDLGPGGLLYLPNALAHSVEAVEPSRVSLTPIGI
jgi:quercetin dioxygenase-like cupin family protein